MAKQIAPTPILRGKEAVEFLLKMQKPLSKEKKELLERIKRNYKPDLF